MPAEPHDASSPLISVEALAARLGDPDLVVCDVRWVLGRPGEGRAAYEAGHVPDAVFLDLDTDLADHDGLGAPGRHPLPTVEAFAATMRSIGVRDGSTVVGYDDAGGWVAARLWWMLDSLGFPGGRVLDGGIGAWMAAGLPRTTDVPIPVPSPAAALRLRAAWTGVVERDDLRSQLGSVTLLDARAAARYRGEVEPIDPVAGHIPTAISAPWDGNMGPDGRLLPAEDLRERYAALGLPPVGAPRGRPVVVACGSGTSALHHSLAMRVAGLPDPILYVGSYSDWSRSGYPVATGPEPGEPPA
jgi:thiosulfate/3-mercaptopyruvate sulfurtransferase